MPKRNTAILVLIDGLSADYFASHRARLPYLSELSDTGLWVQRMRPAVPGTSRPGRAVMLTGTSTAQNGVYGNSVLDGSAFRPASAADVQGPTIAGLALAARLRVASIGFGMVRAEETSALVDPWWEHVALKGQTNIKIPRTRSASVAPIHRDDDGGLQAALSGPPLSLGVQETPDAALHPHMFGMASDQLMLEVAGNLACGDDPPDLILTEFSVTDTIQHYHGFESGATHWAYSTADMAVGLLLRRLDQAGRRDDTLVIVTSDHGHAPVRTAIYPDALVGHDSWSSEGATLHVRTRDETDRDALTARLADLGIEPLDGLHLPERVRDLVVSFVAPSGSAFGRRRTADTPSGAETGTPVVISTHGLHPENPADHGVAFLAGCGASGSIKTSDLRHIAPTIARALGLDPTIFPASSLL